jgi:hypothetical protein
MSKASGQGFKVRLAKAVGYTVIGLMVGFLIGFLTSQEITHRKTVIRDANRIALSGVYTAVLEQRERLLDNGDIEVLDSRVIEVRR